MYLQIYEYLQTNNIIYGSQYGFRKSHSTQMAGIELHSRVHEALNAKDDPFSIFMDLSKAFDLINHNTLVRKLRKYGFSDTAVKLCLNYLSHRQQFVEYGNSISKWKVITQGVPQGSILGPLFFILYINDLPLVSSKFKYIIYADDTCLFSTIQQFDPNNTLNPNVIAENINIELSKINNWVTVNKLKLNVSKTKSMIFHVRQKTIMQPIMKLGNENIEYVDNFNFLGIHIDEFICWSTHIEKLSTKLSRTLGILSRLKNELPHHILKLIYNSLFNSHLYYGILNWGYNSGNISNLQKKAVRVISNCHRHAHTDPLFKFCNILKLDDLLRLEELKLFFKFENGLLPDFFYRESFIEKFTPNSQHYTRLNYIVRPQVSRLALKSLKFNLTLTINTCETIIIDKVHTHSIQGFSLYIKNKIISAYRETCEVPHCYSCQVSLI